MGGTLRILAIDNEPSVTLSLRYVFSDPRYECETVSNATTALTRLDASPDWYDVIIVDQKMPNVTGLELVDAIKRRGITAGVIVVSAHLDSEIRSAYERLGVHTMFGKPFDVELLRSAVANMVA